MPKIPLFWKITTKKTETIIRISEIGGIKKYRECTDSALQTFDEKIRIYFGGTWFEFTNCSSAEALYDIMSATAVSNL